MGRHRSVEWYEDTREGAAVTGDEWRDVTLSQLRELITVCTYITAKYIVFFVYVNASFLFWNYFLDQTLSEQVH